MLLDGHGFVRKFLRDPGRTGALAPATRSLAQTVANATHEAYRLELGGHGGRNNGLSLIELGAGTGALSRSISALNPILVGRDETWARLLKRQFPALEVRAECATHTLRSIVRPVGVVTSIPMLNNPQSSEIRRLLGCKYAEGLIRFCVLYTYGWANPLLGAGFKHGYRESFVARSFPPASVWVYR